MPDATHFDVRVFRHEGGWRVEISDPHRGTEGARGSTGAFAAVEAYDLDTAMRMAVPYLASVAQPDPWRNLLDRVGH